MFIRRLNDNHKDHAPPVTDDANHIFQKPPVIFQSDSKSIPALLLEMRLDIPPNLAVTGRHGDVVGSCQTPEETMNIIEGVFETPQQRLHVLSDLGMSSLQLRIQTDICQFS